MPTRASSRLATEHPLERGTPLEPLTNWHDDDKAESAALGIPPLPLDAKQTAELIELIKSPQEAVIQGDGEFLVDPCNLQQRHKLTPYAGARLHGIVRKTFLRGQCVWDLEREGQPDQESPIRPKPDPTSSRFPGRLL